MVSGVSGCSLARGQSSLQWPKRLRYCESLIHAGVMFAVIVVKEQSERMFPALFIDAADCPNAGLPIKPAALCRNHDGTVF